MKTVAFVVAAVLAWVAISLVVDWARPGSETEVAVATPPDAVQTKLAVQQQIPLQTPIGDAVRAMAANGYACTAWLRERYTDMAETGSPVRGPADVQRCDPLGNATMRRWQVVIEDAGGRVGYIGIGGGTR